MQHVRNDLLQIECQVRYTHLLLATTVSLQCLILELYSAGWHPMPGRAQLPDTSEPVSSVENSIRVRAHVCTCACVCMCVHARLQKKLNNPKQAMCTYTKWPMRCISKFKPVSWFTPCNLKSLTQETMKDYFMVQRWKNLIPQEGHCTMGYNIHIPKEVRQLFSPSKIYVITGTLALFHWP